MKSFILAASAVAVVRASGLDLGLDNIAGGLDTLGLGDALDLGALGINVPLGIKMAGDEEKPQGPPSDGCTNTWHPPHDGIVIDGCDDNHNDHWHYVHPCGERCNGQPPHVWTTSTVTATHTHTVIDCAPTVTDCPAGHKTVTYTIPATTTICPVPVTTPAGDYPTPTGAYPPPEYTPPAYTPPVYTPPSEPTGPVYTPPSGPTGPAYPPPSYPTGPAYPPPSYPTGTAYPPPLSQLVVPCILLLRASPPTRLLPRVHSSRQPDFTRLLPSCSSIHWLHRCWLPSRLPSPSWPYRLHRCRLPSLPSAWSLLPRRRVLPPAPPAGTGYPTGTGSYPAPTLPPVVNSASKQSIGALIFAGLITAFLL
ncbi:hypothetical protein PT974_01214 [Cladobotryum mycophilum]|uniref:Uncharacterized protein n=1 Tax=Cladobotryum mycophilum TaxID=491253 RepID=A0ABR0T330_9HYPO